jgi:hypothetical protein
MGWLRLMSGGRGASGGGGGSYPLGVVAAGLQTEYDIYDNIGPTLSVVNTLPGGAASVPVTISGDDALFATSGTINATRAQFAGYNMVARGTADVTATHFRLSNPGSRIFETQDTCSLVLEDSDVDCTGARNDFAGACQPVAGTDFTVRRSRFTDATMMFINVFSDTCLIENCYFGEYGLDVFDINSHLEAVFIHGGTGGIYNSRFEPASSPPSQGGHTAAIYYEESTANIVHVLSDTVIGWTGSPGIPASVQVAAKNGRSIALTVTGCALKEGTSDYVVVSVLSGSVTITDGGGNYDYDTGATIDVSYP